MAHLESLVVLDAGGRSGAALAFGFERAGYRVYATRDPEDALAMAQTRVPQLLVVSLEGGDALSVVGRLREEAPTRELPVVAVGERGRREEALRAGVDEFVTRPAFIRDVLTLARLAVAVRQDGDDGGVVGLLEDYGLFFLVRALAVAGRSGVLELERGRRVGEVHFAKGVVVAARAGRMSGVPAFHHLLLWGEASLSLRFESPAGERRVAMTVDELLESGAAFAHQFESLASRVGGPLAVYAHEPRRAAEVRAQIPGEVMALVKQYDGRKPLIDIVEDSPFKPFDTIKITYRLAELGAISRRETRETTPLSAQLAVRDWLLGGDGERERPQTATPSGVTEAGRRAAEAYAAEMSARAAERSPADDLFDDRAQLRAAAAARPEARAARGAKKKGRQGRGEPARREAARTAAPAAKPAAAASKPAAAAPKPAAATSPPRTAPAKGTPAPKSTSAAARAAAAKPALSPAVLPAPSPAEQPAKLSPQAAARASGKEPVFDAVEEEFFAREAELHRPPTVDTFDDLEPRPQRRKLSPRRDWFGFKKKP